MAGKTIFFQLPVVILAGLSLISCGIGKAEFSYDGVELGMTVDELLATGKVARANSLASLMNPGYQPFRFKDRDFDSVVVQDGIVTAINVNDFSKTKGVEEKKQELIEAYGEPSFVLEVNGECLMGWGEVKKAARGWSAKGSFVTAVIVPGATNLSLIKGDPSGWNNYSPAIVM